MPEGHAAGQIVANPACFPTRRPASHPVTDKNGNSGEECCAALSWPDLIVGVVRSGLSMSYRSHLRSMRTTRLTRRCHPLRYVDHDG
jgi:hypothetical protein